MKRITHRFGGIVLLSLLLSSCCQDLQCPALGEEDKNDWLPQRTGDQISFEKEDGSSTFSFQVYEKQASEAYKEKAHQAELGCHVSDCGTNGYVRAKGQDSALSYFINITGYFTEDKESQRTLNYSLGDFSGSFRLYPYVAVEYPDGNAQLAPDSIISNLILGNMRYDHVIIQTRKLPSPDGLTYRINKVYLAAPYGIVGYVNNAGERYFRKR